MGINRFSKMPVEHSEPYNADSEIQILATELKKKFALLPVKAFLQFSKKHTSMKRFRNNFSKLLSSTKEFSMQP